MASVGSCLALFRVASAIMAILKLLKLRIGGNGLTSFMAIDQVASERGLRSASVFKVLRRWNSPHTFAGWTLKRRERRALPRPVFLCNFGHLPAVSGRSPGRKVASALLSIFNPGLIHELVLR